MQHITGQCAAAEEMIQIDHGKSYAFELPNEANARNGWRSLTSLALATRKRQYVDSPNILGVISWSQQTNPVGFTPGLRVERNVLRDQLKWIL